MSDNRDVQRAAGQEIPDRRTTQAAAWLTEHAATLSTPEFWMIAGLLGMYGEKIATQVREQTVAECAGIIRAYDHAATLLTDQQLIDNPRLMEAVIEGRKLFPAPPETTEQERG